MIPTECWERVEPQEAPGGSSAPSTCPSRMGFAAEHAGLVPFFLGVGV